jgi:hypothetical protein
MCEVSGGHAVAPRHAIDCDFAVLSQHIKRWDFVPLEILFSDAFHVTLGCPSLSVKDEPPDVRGLTENFRQIKESVPPLGVLTEFDVFSKFLLVEIMKKWQIKCFPKNFYGINIFYVQEEK